jgi:hypothetical protein
MATSPAEETPTPRSIAAYVKKNAARARKVQQMHHGESVITRQTEYKGHHILVRTKYEVEVDGKPLMGHLGVNDEGSVHYHPIPNLRFDSALDMVKKIIDVFADDFGHHTDPHSGSGTHGAHGVSGVAMKRKPVAKKTGKSARKSRK